MDYINETKTLFIGTNQKNILTQNIEKLLDFHIHLVDFKKGAVMGEEEQETFDLSYEMQMKGYKPGLNINDILNHQGESTNLDNMEQVEKILSELKVKEERDREEVQNRSEFLDDQENENDEALKKLLQEQERILKQDKIRGYK